MPTRTFTRTWCKTCNDWKLFYKPFAIGEETETQCVDCKSPIETVMLSEIPEEKILEQRKRYKQKQAQDFNYIMGGYMQLFSSSSYVPGYGGSDDIVVESDAGWEREYQAQKAAKRKAEQEHQEFVDRYKGLGRNDTCACDSGKKFKKCCYSKVQA